MASSDPSNIEPHHSSSEEEQEEVAIVRRMSSVRSPRKSQNPPPGEEEASSPCKAQWELVSSRRSRRRPANSTLPSTSNATASRALNLDSQEEFPALQLSGSPSSSSSGDPYAKVVSAAIR